MPEVLDLACDTRRSWLEALVFRGIVFNMSWEDPEMDRRAFNITPDDTVISITSAGCNPLNFLCQSPRKLISIDSNPAQTAMLELKLAAIETLDHDAFFDIFAARRPSRVLRVYRPRLRPRLSPRAQEFWDRKLWIVARDLYGIGRNGVFFRIMRAYLRLIGIDVRKQDAFFECRTLEEQNAWYWKHIAPRLWRGTSKLFVYFRPFMYLAGVHPNQFRLVDGRHDMYEYVRERIEYAFTRVPIYDNYFMSIAVTGRFRGERVPPYLLKQNFATLRRNLDRVLVVNGWLGPFLDAQPPESIGKFNLLAIFDWMTPAVMEGTMHSVLRAAAPGATMIYRSGSYRLEPPAAVLPHLEPRAELARDLFAGDRSATYGSFYIYTIKPPAPEDKRARRRTTATVASA
ncbi:MAG TPA: BtaA family protein [Phycisphaerae bacterium]|nr:BtaA family protein [Phycisphaerae bacterium]